MNFCKLARGVRLFHQHSISMQHLIEGHRLLVEYVQEFEKLYYQRKESRLHALLHIGPEIARIGPPVYYTQWCMERTIGILGQEIRQPSNPFQNLSERGLQRACINALESIIPDLVKLKIQPRVSEDLGDGFILLGRRDSDARSMHPMYIPALHTYFESVGIPVPPNWTPRLKRWARIQLPNKQIVRTAWKEKARSGSVRTSRNIMVCIKQSFNVLSLTSLKWFENINRARTANFGEVQFFFRANTGNNQMKGLALVSVYGQPDPDLLRDSSQALWVSRYHGMIPFTNHQTVVSLFAKKWV